MNESQQTRVIELAEGPVATSPVSALLQTDSVSACRPLMQLWAMRMITHGTRPEHALAKGGPALDALLDLPPPPTFDLKINDEAERLKEAGRMVEERLAQAESSAAVLADPLARNLSRLAKAAGLSDVDQEVLAAAMLARIDEGLQAAFEAVSQRYSETSLARTLAHAFGRGVEEVAAALDWRSTLCRSGLIVLDSGGKPFLEKMMLMAGMTRAFTRAVAPLGELLWLAFRRAPAPILGFEHFPHLQEPLGVLIRYLATIAGQARAGVNVLIFGKPGVGKTELARLIARESGMEAFEVPAADPRNYAMRRGERLRMLSLAQRVLAGGPASLVLFDEADDVFLHPWAPRSLDDNSPTSSKGWTNTQLEENATPTIWIANRVSHLDAAYLRRFDMVLEVTPPTRKVRASLIRSSLPDLAVESRWVERNAENPHLTPALIERIGRVVHMSGVADADAASRRFDLLARGAFAAQEVFSGGHYPEPARYRPEWTNTNVDLNRVCAGLRTRGKGRLLLYGPPGTGKTAFAHHLAKELDRPLLVRRSSDLQSMWLGETEKNIVRAFREASEEGAVLVLDEADSFLQDRWGAVRSWEVSQVNELLAQMECFEGVLICATNSIERLDAASLRRFAMKIEFHFLTLEQRMALFADLLNQDQSEPLTSPDFESACRILGELTNLTPGDFAAVRQRVEIVGDESGVSKLLEMIREESRLKPGGQKTVIGFT
jgi:transitional endoplasmic reticulum ATPase